MKLIIHLKTKQKKTGHILPITSEILKAAHHKKSGGEGSYISNGGSGIHKDFLMVVAEEEESASTIENFLYEITESPAFGKLQFRFKSFYEDLTGPYATLNKFTQNDIDEGTFLVWLLSNCLLLSC